jgi:16S rRNA processing protein RimM
MARVGAPFGVKGWIKVHTFTETPDSLDHYATWLLRAGDEWQSFELEDFAVRSNGVVAKLAGVEDRSAAERLAKRDIGIPRADLIEEEGAVLWLDLIGCEVRNRAGRVFGNVETLMETGANDVLVVRDGGTESLIPYINGVVVDVDRTAKRIVVDWSGEYQ